MPWGNNVSMSLGMGKENGSYQIISGSRLWGLGQKDISIVST